VTAGPDIDALPGGIDLQLGVQIGRLAAVLERQQERAQRLMQALHQVPIGPAQIPIATGAGQLVQDPAMGPNTGYFWSIRRLAVWGFTAGTVNVYLNAVGGELLPSFPTAGVATFGRGEILLNPNDNLVFQAQGITLASGFGGVQVAGIADNGELWTMPDYLS
jgi:hypothetical protein